MSGVLSESDELVALGNVYALLGRIWLQELDEALLAQFQEAPLRLAFSSAQDDAVPALENLDDLAAEYCRLFIGPREHFPPLQSVWQEGKLDSEISASVRSFAGAIGYESSSDYPNTLVDHLGIELEIMGRAVHTIAGQLTSEQDAGETQAFASEFFRRHLCWTDRLITAALGKVENEFYRSMLVTTRDFLQAEQGVWIGSQ